jgi:hypothetical protein
MPDDRPVTVPSDEELREIVFAIISIAPRSVEEAVDKLRRVRDRTREATVITELLWTLKLLFHFGGGQEDVEKSIHVRLAVIREESHAKREKELEG